MKSQSLALLLLPATSSSSSSPVRDDLNNEILFCTLSSWSIDRHPFTVLQFLLHLMLLVLGSLGSRFRSHWPGTAAADVAHQPASQRRTRSTIIDYIRGGGHKKHRHCSCVSLADHSHCRIESIAVWSQVSSTSTSISSNQPDYLLSVYDHIVRLNGRLFHFIDRPLLVISSFKSSTDDMARSSSSSAWFESAFPYTSTTATTFTYPIPLLFRTPVNVCHNDRHSIRFDYLPAQWLFVCHKLTVVHIVIHPNQTLTHLCSHPYC